MKYGPKWIYRQGKRVLRMRYVGWYRNEYLKHQCLANTVLIESTHGNDFYGHMFYLTQALAEKRPDLTLIVGVVPSKIETVRQNLAEHGLANVQIVSYLGRDYCRYLASAQYLLNDTSFYSFFAKQEFQQYVIFWHGTPLKYLGKDDGDIANMGNVQRNFYMADKLFVSNTYTGEAMVRSYNLKGVMPGQIIVGPSPRNSALLDEKLRSQMRHKYQLENKEVLVYMPTWRGIVGKTENHSATVSDYLERLDQTLTDNQILYVKLHPFEAAKVQLNYDKFRHIQAFPTEIETYAFLSATDGLITDYSSIMYDYMNTGKPIVLFAYDKDEYYQNRGCYEDIDSYPFTQVKTIDSLQLWVANADKPVDYRDSFAERFISRDTRQGAAVAAEQMFLKMTSGANFEVMTPANGRENVVIFPGNFASNGITTALENILDNVDLTKRNYIIAIDPARVEAVNFWRLMQLPENVAFYVLPAGKLANLRERVLTRAVMRFPSQLNWLLGRVQQAVYEREYPRLFAPLHPRMLIHFSGYDREPLAIIKALTHHVKDLSTTVYVHNDMAAEKKARGNAVAWPLLEWCYNRVDHVVLVNETLRHDFLMHYPAAAHHVMVINNFLGEKRVRRMAQVDLPVSLLNAPLGDNPNESTHEPIANALDQDAAKQFVSAVQEAVSSPSEQAADHSAPVSKVVEEINDTYKKLVPTAQFPVTSAIVDRLYNPLQQRLLADLADPAVHVFMNIGRMVYAKGFDRLIHAFADVHRHHSSTRLVIVAPFGDLFSEVTHWIADSGAAEDIYLIQGLSNPYPLLAAADTFVFSSRYEGLGLVVFEALAVNTPVVTVDLAATVAVLKPGNALIVENSTEGLASGMTKSLNVRQPAKPFNFEAINGTTQQAFEQLFAQ